MTQGPKNSFLHRRQQQLVQEGQMRFCPFSIRPPVEATVLSADGQPTPPRVNASPCLGEACVGYTVFQPDPTSKQTIGECRLCMIPNLLTGALPALFARLDVLTAAVGGTKVKLAPVPDPVPNSDPDPAPVPGSDPAPTPILSQKE